MAIVSLKMFHSIHGPDTPEIIQLHSRLKCFSEALIRFKGIDSIQIVTLAGNHPIRINSWINSDLYRSLMQESLNTFWSEDFVT